MVIDWHNTLAAIWRGKRGVLRPVVDIDLIQMVDLLNIEPQKQAFCQNLERFLTQQPSNHVLLWGSRGTGKSSLIKAALNQYHAQNLRVVEVEKQDIEDLPEISDLLRGLPWRFIIYCDDLTFEANDVRYRYLKVLMEGSIEKPPENILMMATSNRRHLVVERMQDNLGAGSAPNGEIHHGDAVEESISLADRFGLSLSFYPASQQEYLQCVDRLFVDYDGQRQQLHREAINFATQRGGRSGRVAQQFFNAFSGLKPRS